MQIINSDPRLLEEFENQGKRSLEILDNLTPEEALESELLSPEHKELLDAALRRADKEAREEWEASYDLVEFQSQRMYKVIGGMIFYLGNAKDYWEKKNG